MFFYTLLEKIERLTRIQQQKLFDFIVDDVNIPYVKVSNGVELYINGVEQSKIQKLNSFIDSMLDLDTNIPQHRDANASSNSNDAVSLTTLKEKICKLSYIEHDQILKFLCSKFVSYSQNNNGYFVCLNSLSPKTLQELDALVNFFIQSKQLLEQCPVKNIKKDRHEDVEKEYEKEDEYLESIDNSFLDDVSFSKKLLPSKSAKTSNNKQNILNEQRQKKKTAQMNAISEQQSQACSNGAPLDQVKTEIQKYSNLKKRYVKPWPKEATDTADPDDLICDSDS